MIAVVVVRDGVLPVGADEAVAEAGGEVVVVGSKADVAARELRTASVLHVVEAVRQLRGDALGAQVSDAKVAVVTAEGAMLGTNTTLILGR